MMPMALSMVPFHFLGQDEQNEVQHNIFGHVMPLLLASASHDADGIINSTIVFFRSRKLNLSATCPFHHLIQLSMASCDADSVINGTIAFLRST